MAAVNPNITHTAIDGALFAAEVESRQIMSVPNVFLNDAPFAQGRMDVAAILAKLDTNAPAQAAAKMKAQDIFDALIVGAGPSGAAAAIYLARKGLKVAIAAERLGGQVLDTLDIGNFIGTVHIEGPNLARNLEAHINDYQIDVFNNVLATKLQITPNLYTVEFNNNGTLKAKTLLIATGAKWREMNIPGEAEYKTRGVCFCPHCDGPLFKGKKVAVIGGGNSGIEAAIDLAGICAEVTVLEFADKCRADQILLNKANSLSNVTIITNAQTLEVVGDGNKVTGLTYQDRQSKQTAHLECAGIFVQIGLVPNTAWLNQQLNQNARAEIVIDERCQTSQTGIFAAGDCTSVPYKQIIIAAGNGATAALTAFDYLITKN